MKIADPENIKAGEQDLIDTIREKVDLQVIEDVVARQISLKNLEFNEGDIVIHEGNVAYRLDFTVHVGVSVLFDREGNLLSDAPVELGGSDEDEELPAEDVSSVGDLLDEIASMGDVEPVEPALVAEAEPAPVSDVEPVEAEPAPVSELEALLGKNRDYWVEKVDSCRDDGQE